EPTVFENYVHDIFIDNVHIELSLWDTAGQEEFDRLRSLSYDNTHAIMLCFSLDSRVSFTNVTGWMREIMDHCPGAKLVLIGLKSDLRPDLKFSSQGAGVENEGEDQIDRKEKIEETEEKGPIQLVEIEEKRISINAAQYMSCSAKYNEKVNDVFTAAARAALSIDDSREPKRQIILFFTYLPPGAIAAPIDGASAFTNSSDAWASLVANVAPLLILVGEKHVKAYFKTMFRRSEFFLYAVSPIGLVTALVTLIRLYGYPLMKRIIGRQFETRAEVLADVTSVSVGEVSSDFHRHRLTLEQTTMPSPEHQALFGVYLRTKASDATMFSTLYQRAALVRDYRDSVFPSAPELSWYSLNIIRVHGTDSIATSRDLTSTMVECENQLRRRLDIFSKYDNLKLNDPVDSSTGTPNPQRCEFIGLTYIEGVGVSASLTAGDGGSHNKIDTQMYRYIAGSVCACLNIAVVITNAIVYRNALTSTLIAVGIAGSFFGSWKTAYLVYRATDVRMIFFRDLAVLRGGFFSKTAKEGADMATLPRSIAISKASQFRPTISVITSTVIISSFSFVSLYLGLRAAAWWVSLIMLANVALTSCMRAFLSEDLVLTKLEGKPWNFTTFRNCRGLCPHMFVDNADSTLHDQIGLCKENSRQLPKNSNNGTSCHQNAEPKVPWAWTVLSTAGNIGPDQSLATDRLSYQELALITNAFAVVLALQTKGLQPRELDMEPLTRTHTRYIRSEFLATDGVWQQDLDLYIPHHLHLSDHPEFLEVPRKIAALLRVWATAALVGEHKIQKNCTFSPFTQSACEEQATAPSYPCDLFIRADLPPQEPELYQIFRIAQSMVKNKRDLMFNFGQLWSNKIMLWMTVKILFTFKASWPRSQNEDFPTMLRTRWEALAAQSFEVLRIGVDPNVTTGLFYDGRNETQNCHSENVPLYVDCLETAGLVESVHE
ncbi:Rho GTPase, partial [Lignoscripta atroalba]|nr:Rho GTPase [Lignoscripta atroalba]